MKKILALDIASATGWAHNSQGNVELGTWQLSTPAEVRRWGQQRMTRRNDPRVLRLFQHLQLNFKPDVVVFEDVQFQSYTQQCQLWSSLRAAVWLAFDTAHVECVPVQTLKQFATGHGGATKSMMMSAAVRDSNNRFIVRDVKNGEVVNLTDTLDGKLIDDNAIDAYHLFRWAQRNLGRMAA